MKTSFKVPNDISFHDFEEFDALLSDTDLLLCGVSSFGVDWFCETIVPRIPEHLPVLSVTKGMIDDARSFKDNHRPFLTGFHIFSKISLFL